MAGITLKETDDTLVPTPASGKATIFFDDADGLPKYKDDTGTVSTLGGGGGGSMTTIGTFTVTGSAATTLAATGLDLSAYEAFFVVVNAENATGSAASISLFYNADTTATNYYRQSFYQSNATTGGARTNNANVFALDANECTNAQMFISRDRDGRARCRCHSVQGAAASILLALYSHIWTNTGNVTDITLSSSVSNSLAVGTTMTIYGIN
jgi:hypothetical protein